MKFLSYFLSIVVLLILAIFLINQYIFEKVTSNESMVSGSIGGEFILHNQDGDEFSNRNLLSKYTMVFFGFSRCPHICPTHLAILSNIIEEVNSEDLQTFFITVDPLNDDIKTLKKFHENFDRRIQMLTGSEEMINKVINDYKVYVSLSEKPEDINHSTIVYIMGKDGKYIEHLNLSIFGVDEIVKNLKNIMKR